MMSKIFCVIVMSFFLPGLKAQEVKPICDTLVLANGRELIILVESVSATHLFYKRCNNSSDLVLSMPLNYIKGLKADGDIRPIKGVTGPSIIAQDSSNAPVSSPVWTFWNKVKNKKYRISEGDLLKVEMRQDHRPIIIKGNFYALDENHFVIRTNNKALRQIPKQSITSIKVLKPASTAGVIAGGVAVVTGIGTIVLVLMIVLIVGSLAILLSLLSGDKDSSNPAKDDASGGWLIGGLLVLIGLVALITSLPKSSGIEYPFSDDWEVYQEGVTNPSSTDQMRP